MHTIEPLARAAQAVHEGFAALLSGGVAISTEGQLVADMMCKTAFQNWTTAVVLTGAGEAPIGLAAVRRSLEFCCYAAKVVNKPKRARDWLKAANDPGAWSRFWSACRIPNAYKDDDYRFLRPIIAHYDVTSDYGVHANLKSLAGLLKMANPRQPYIQQQTDPEQTKINTLNMIVLGYRIYTAMLEILKTCIEDSKQQWTLHDYVKGEIRRLRLIQANVHHGGKVPPEIYKAIATDDVSYWEQRFEEYAARSPVYTCPECGHTF